MFLIVAMHRNEFNTLRCGPLTLAVSRPRSRIESVMPKKSRLHTPRPHSRPGEVPDFSYLETSPAGAVARPDVNARVRDIGHLAVDLVRVLDDQHRATGPWHPHLEPGDLQVALRHMLLTRIFDDRMQRSQRQGKANEKLPWKADWRKPTKSLSCQLIPPEPPAPAAS